MLNIIVGCVYQLVCAVLCVEGANWITEGHGLNPWVAFPIAAIAAVLAIYNAWIGCEIIRYNWMTKELERKMKRLTLHI